MNSAAFGEQLGSTIGDLSQEFANRQRLSSEDMRIEVDVSVDNPIGYFSQVRTVTFAIPEGTRPGEYEVLVGFIGAAAPIGKPKRT